MVTIPMWLAVVVVLGLPIAGFAARTWLKAFIERRVQFGMESQLEGVRGEIRKSEERVKSDLRSREAELASLREGVMGGRAARMALVDKRRIEAVDRLWLAVSRLSRMKGPAMSLSILKVDAVASRVPKDPKVREFVEIMTNSMGGSDFEERMKEIRADEERPFVSDLAWALYSAYAAVVLGGWAVLKMLSFGAEDVDKLINRKHVDDLLKAALPHQAAYIDKYGAGGHVHLLDELERHIIAELRRSLNGEEADAENVKRSSDIMQQVAKVTTDTQKMSSAAAAL